MDGVSTGLGLHTLLCNREFDVNANYRIYYGVHDDGGELLWDSKIDGNISCNDFTGYHITYITTDKENSDLIIEIA